MSRVQFHDSFHFLCFPRVSGDEPPGVGAGASAWVFSPRERG